MLGKIILIVLQVVIAWFLAPLIFGQIPVPGEFGLFVYALIFAVAVFVTGLLGSFVLKDVGTPSSATLTSAVLLALVAAAIAKYAVPYVPSLNTISQRNLVLAGAILGYFLRR